MEGKIKKYIFYLDSKNEHRFLLKDISEDEQRQIDNYFIIEKNNMKNPNKLPYIQLMTVINELRIGRTDIFHKRVFFYEKDQLQGKRTLLNSLGSMIGKRSKESLQNLTFLTEENLKYFEELKESLKPKKEELPKEKKKKTKEETTDSSLEDKK